MKEKKCKKCEQVKPIDDFEENPYSPDGRYLICKACFVRLANESVSDNRPPGDEKTGEKTVGSGRFEQAVVSSKPVAKAPKEATGPGLYKPIGTSEQSGFSSNDWALKDYSDRNEKELSRPKIQKSPAPDGEVLPKLRKCSVCKKIEVVDKVPEFQPTPVQAWFCESCRDNKRHLVVVKGHLVYDYWGKVYKITRVLNNNVVQGVVKKSDGRWSTRKFEIIGRWRTKKPV